ncbi:MAG: hypothetical protein IPF99_35780 [Deltaproteobacteria bacterium]|nr:hypothetical protein [Deltaproteobacteria bacterium]
MTRTWRLESYALLGLWAAASALLLFMARIPHRPILVPSMSRPRVLLSTPPRRPPVARPPSARSVSSAASPAVAVGEGDGPERSGVTDSATRSPVEVIELDGIDVYGSAESYSEDYPYDGYRWHYRSHFQRGRWSRSWRFRRGQSLRPASSAFFSDGAVPPGAAGDPCGVFPGACSPAQSGGAYSPAPTAARLARAGVIAHREYGSPAVVTRDGDLWRLGNDEVTIDINALCLMTSLRVGDPTPSVATFAPPVEVPCVVRETAVPWDDRAGAAIEMSWSAPGGSMRAVVALADEGEAAEASVARTDGSGETWLSNMGTSALTWTIAGSPVTVAPGGSVRVSARRSAAAGT